MKEGLRWGGRESYGEGHEGRGGYDSGGGIYFFFGGGGFDGGLSLNCILFVQTK
jgi:hypothetical protein